MAINNAKAAIPGIVRKMIFVLVLSIGLNSCAFVADLFLIRPSSIPIGDFSFAVEYADRSVRRGMRKLDIPSIAVALVDDQSIVYDFAYGIVDIDTGEEATLDTIYKAGSITKLFTGIEIMRMYEDGLVDLDAPITTYLPDFDIETDFPDSDPITIRSIMSHRSGLPRNSGLLGWYWDSSPNVLEAQVDSVTDLFQAFPVGIGINTRISDTKYSGG